MSTPPSNPYIGPRSFEEGEGARFFGRERELGKLLNLLIARRLVLLYAPSGAGKTSLINAALIPQLRAEGFVVRRPVRLNAELSAAALPLAANRYGLATRLALDEELPPAERATPTELAQTNLGAYLDRRQGASDADEVLIFDQFEELLTTDPTDRGAKEQFLAELGAALENPRRWALFAIREDYLGSLRPLLVRLPTRLDALFRLDLLDPTQARRAAQGPALAAGVPFTNAAVTTLIDDLRRTIVQRPDGTSELVLGETIEPVQLQVVCYRLWKTTVAADDGSGEIGEAALTGVPTVDQALADYYATSAELAARTHQIDEQRVRDWVEYQLITANGLRGQVLRQPGATAELANEAIQELVDAHLVRGEERRGALWYELAHDRLIEPVRASNTAWRTLHLSLMQRRATQWEQEGRPDGLLLHGPDLRQAERDLRAAKGTLRLVRPRALSATEQAFLERSRSTERQARRLRRLAWVASAVSLVALVLAAVAFTFYGQANDALRDAERSANRAQTSEADAVKQAMLAQTAEAQALTALASLEVQNRVSLARQVALQSQSLRATQTDLAALLAVQSVQIDQNDLSLANLFTTLGASLPVVAVRGNAAERTFERRSTFRIVRTTVSPDGTRAAFRFSNGEVQVWDVTAAQPRDRFYVRVGENAAISFSHDGRLVALADERTTPRRVLIRDVVQQKVVATYTFNSFEQITPIIGDLAFSPNDRLLAIGSSPLVLWNWQDGTSDTIDSPGLLRVAFSPDSQLLALSGRGGLSMVDLQSQQRQTLTFEEGAFSGLRGVAFSPDSSLLAAGTFNGISLFDTASLVQVAQLNGNNGGSPLVVAFSRDGLRIALGNYSGNTVVWTAEQVSDASLREAWLGVNAPPAVYRQHVGLAYGLAALADDQFVSTSTEGAILFWDFAAAHPSRHEVGTGSTDSNRVAEAERSPALFRFSLMDRIELRDSDGIQRATVPLSQATVALRPDGTVLAVADQVALRLFDVQRNQFLDIRTDELAGSLPELFALQYSPDGTTLAAILGDRTPLFDGHTLAPGVTLPARFHGFSADGRSIATWQDGEPIRFWEAQSGRQIGSLPSDLAGSLHAAADGGWVMFIDSADSMQAFDATGQPRGQTIVFERPWELARTVQGGSAVAVLARQGDGFQLQLRDATSLSLMTTRTLPIGAVDSVVLSPDATKLAYRVCLRSVGPAFRNECVDWRMYVFDIEQGVEFVVPDNGIPLAFGSDGQRFFTFTTPDSLEQFITVYRWNFDSDHWLEAACSLANRNLSLSEWRRFVSLDEPYKATCLKATDGGLAIEALVHDQQFDAAFAANDGAQAGDWSPQTWNALCAAGVFAERVDEGLQACDQAVMLDPTSGRWREMRGVARALVGEYAGAAEDLRAFAAWTPDQETRDQVLAWLSRLDRGENPFDRPTLNKLHSELFGVNLPGG